MGGCRPGSGPDPQKKPDPIANKSDLVNLALNFFLKIESQHKRQYNDDISA